MERLNLFPEQLVRIISRVPGAQGVMAGPWRRPSFLDILMDLQPKRTHRIGPGRRTVFTIERERYKRARSKYPYPHQSTRERTRAKRRAMKEMLS